MFEFDYVSTTRPEGQAVVNLSKGQFLRFCRYVKLIQKSQERRPPPPVQPGHSILHLQFGRALRFHKMGVARRAASKAGRRPRPMFLCVRTRVADAGCLPCTTCVCVPDRCCRARAGVVCWGLAALQPPAVDELGRTQAEVDAHNARVRALELDAKATAARESPSPLHRRSPSPPLLPPQAPNNGSMTLAGSSPPPLSEAIFLPFCSSEGSRKLENAGSGLSPSSAQSGPTSSAAQSTALHRVGRAAQSS